jgi:hypothetical protein
MYLEQQKGASDENTCIQVWLHSVLITPSPQTCHLLPRPLKMSLLIFAPPPLHLRAPPSPSPPSLSHHNTGMPLHLTTPAPCPYITTPSLAVYIATPALTVDRHAAVTRVDI